MSDTTQTPPEEEPVQTDVQGEDPAAEDDSEAMNPEEGETEAEEEAEEEETQESEEGTAPSE